MERLMHKAETSLGTRFRLLIKQYMKHKFLVVLMIPGLVSLLIFNYAPMYGVVIAFKDYRFVDGILGSQWVGLKHFQDVFRYPSVWRAVTNSFVIGVGSTVFGYMATIAFALLLNELRSQYFKRITQTIAYLPHFLSWVVVAALVTDILSPNRGLLNNLIVLLGGERHPFLLIPEYFRDIVIISGIWKSVGWGTIIYLAAIAGADPELYDAANMDGASRWNKIWNITIPAMHPVMTITMILSLSGILGGDFEQIYNLVNSQTMAVGEVISIYVYRSGLENYQYSFATAVGLLNALVSITLIYGANKIARRVSEYAIW